MLLPVVSNNSQHKRAKIDYDDFMRIYEQVCRLRDVDVYIAKKWAEDDFINENVFEMHIKYKNDKFYIGWNEYGSSICIYEDGLLANSPWHNGGYYDMEYYCDGEDLRETKYETPYTMYNFCRAYFTLDYLDTLLLKIRSYM